jgi:hypothetical protein|tara:strand:- start:4542 stop:5255 length:714 start_codon:yes stop_codon:yes gene_type:complete
MNTHDKLKEALKIYEDDFAKNAIKIGHGKKYGTVNQRLKAFRRYFPDAAITTEVIKNEKIKVKNLETEVVVLKCSISVDDRLISTGIAEEFREGSAPVNLTSFWEVCETSAIGRSLANLGFSGQEFASYEEIKIAETKKKTMEEVPKSETTVEFTKSEEGKPIARVTLSQSDILEGLKSFALAIDQAKHIGHLSRTVAEHKKFLDILDEESKQKAREIYSLKETKINTLQKGRIIHE